MLPLSAATTYVVLSVFGGGLTAGYWVYRDALVRGSDQPGTWGMLSALLVVPVLPLYLYVRRGLGARREWRKRDRAAGTAAATLLGSWAIVAVVAPPDPYTQLRWAVPITLVTAVLAQIVAARRVPVRGPSQ